MFQEELCHGNYCTPKTDKRTVERSATILVQSCKNKHNFAMYEKPVLVDQYSFNSIPLLHHKKTHKKEVHFTKECEI